MSHPTDELPPQGTYEERIRSAYPGLTASFKRLGDFILDSYTQIAFLTATEVAHALDLDPATVVRFAQRLGYAGYPDMQREVQQRVRRELMGVPEAMDSGPPEAADEALRLASEHLSRARSMFPVEAAQRLIAALDEAQRVVILAEGAARAPAQSLATALESSGAVVQFAAGSAHDIARALSACRRKDLVLAVELGGDSPLIERAVKLAKARGVTTAALVATPSAASARQGDLVLALASGADRALGPLLLQALVLALTAMLEKARPGRFATAEERVEELAEQISSGREA